MEMDKSRLFVGKPIRVINNIYLYSPKVDEVTEIGEGLYSINFILSSFNKKDILIDLFQVPEQEINKLSNIDEYDLITSNIGVQKEISSALSFFVKEEVIFDPQERAFLANSTYFLTKENYKEFSKAIKIINGRIQKDDEEDPPRFANKLAEAMYREMMKLKEQAEKIKQEKQGLEFKDVLSILCNADGNGINVFNIKDMTMYQVYEQFERMNLKDSRQTLIPVWAAGNLDTKKHQLPEWIVKSKL